MMAFVTFVPLSGSGKHTASRACGTSSQTCMVTGKTIGETIGSKPNLSVVNNLLKIASIDPDDLGGGTFFAPSNKAFSSMRYGLLEELEGSPSAAFAVLIRHFLPKETITITDMKIQGCGFWDSVLGGPLPFIAAGVARIQISGASIEPNVSEDICDNGVIHQMRDVILDVPRSINKPLSIFQGGSKYMEVEPTAAIKLSQRSSIREIRAREAASKVSTVGGRKAMGLMRQLPFWMYGPPFNAAKQEEYEPISIAVPSYATAIDYQVMPPGTVVVVPDEVSAAKLNPISGMSKYIGNSKKLVEGDALSDYSKLD